ncbi:3-phenylpropionate/cinnamic acid dioxygenase small subunit [Litorivivens lipolytica]|uniref:3-phenylpropionate/cinnamic acid dioxygenase small subunit n=1 Tax=Litorivivens lipolytica TaxID=1524264 RepID=A0A7W4W538_9GAMM|nr:nuclear transport factor 2 family protein [Litorivivens lipolytica]MBB3047490.1 3-phenylpropionate/cinnamic acid dioxygenase small subunit [Litorivivens lipolytica]
MDDYRAIENLMYRYAFLLDDGDLNGVAELFRHGEIVAPAADSVVQGYDAVLQMYQQSTRLFDCSTPRTKHLITNTHIEVSDATAKARAYFTVVQQTPELPLQVIISGYYRDQFARIDGEWCFKRREMHPDLFGDLSQHLLFDAAGIQ